MHRNDDHSSIRRYAAPALRRRVTALLVLIALMFGMGGIVAGPRADAAMVDADLHVLCTAGGMVPLGDDGTAVPEDGELSCVFCLPLMNGGTAPVATSRAPSAPAEVVALVFPATPAPAAKLRRAAAPASPRAPPV